MHTKSVKTVLNRVASTMLRRVSISLLAALMVVSSFSLSSIASADPTTSSEWVPTYLGSEIDGDSSLYMYFYENMTVNNTTSVSDATYLKSQLTIATNGVNFVALPVQSEVELYGNEIDLNYDLDMPIVQGPNTHIKIAAGTLKDGVGNLNSELILDVAPPAIQSAAISNNNHDVTITFQEDVYDNTLSNNWISHLAHYIYLIRDGSHSNEVRLGVGDSVTIDTKGNLVVHFAQALTGSNNQIIIKNYDYLWDSNNNYGPLKDSYGNVISNVIATPNIQAMSDVTDTSAPTLVESYFTNSYHDMNLVFDEDVLNNMGTTESLKAAIYRYFEGLGWGTGIPVELTLTILGNTITIHSEQSFSGQYQLQIPANSIKDSSGNINMNPITSDWMYAYPLSLSSGKLTNGRNLNITFRTNDNSIVDNTIIDGISHLKGKMTISTDGTNYSPLAEQDVVSIQDDRLVVIFHDRYTSGSIKVKIEAGALSDVHNNVQNAAIEEWFGYSVPILNGYLYSDTTSEITFEDNELWRSKVNDITINVNNATTILPQSEYTLTAGKLTISPNVFMNGKNYQINISADGYTSNYIYGKAVKSSELFYMTAPVITTNSGLTAKINVVNMYSDNNNYTGTQSIVFQLMKGNTPVSIVAANLKMSTGMYSASFNVTDATNPAYSVRAFIVNKFDTDFTSVGINLATKVTQTEIDLILNEYNYDN